MKETLRGMRWGTDLTEKQQAEVKRRYIYRMTTESIAECPPRAEHMRRNGYRMPERTDAEWIAATQFPVGKNGHLRGGNCVTYWPPEVIEAARLKK